MRVLWFEMGVTPAGYNGGVSGKGGWQDALEQIVVENTDIELFVAFYSEGCSESKKRKSGNVVVTYIPITIKMSFREKLQSKYSWEPFMHEGVKAAQKLIQSVNPDIVHVFGTEWPWGIVAKETNVPVVVHIQGAVIPYFVSNYSPGYSMLSVMCRCFPSLRHMLHLINDCIKYKSWIKCEKLVWKNVDYYMGRTKWDRALVNVFHPSAKYFFVNEALRPAFMNSGKHWTSKRGNHIKLLSTGCSSFRKGPEVILRTACILKEMGVDFEWSIIGGPPEIQRRVVEKTEGKTFSENNIHLLGFKRADEIMDLICDSTLYVHTAHMENSPNSICEAQILGLPIVCTNVGGIETLIGDTGILVPDDDSWMLASEIVSLATDEDRMIELSTKGRKRAEERHAPISIAGQLMDCYTAVIRNASLNVNTF